MGVVPDAAEQAPLGLGAALLDLVVPQACAGCGRAGSCWCPGCAAAVHGAARRLEGGVPGAAAGEHAGPLGRAVVAFKDRGVRRLVAPLGRSLAEAARLALAGVDVAGAGDSVWLIPVPSRAEARRRRGSDHMAVLAARAARELRRSGVSAHRCRLLAQAAPSRDQVGLDRAQRRANLAGTMRAATPPPGILVVVDDVTTTGATLREAVRALRAASAGSAGAVPGAAPNAILAATITQAGRLGGHAS